MNKKKEIRECEICGRTAYSTPGIFRTCRTVVAPHMGYKAVCQHCRAVLSRDQFPNNSVGKYRKEKKDVL